MRTPRLIRPEASRAAVMTLASTRARWRLATFASVLLLGATTSFAQTMHTIAEVSRAAEPSLDVFMPEVARAGRTMPVRSPSVVVDASLQGVVDDLLRRSATFRRQWCRLVRNPRLVVHIRLVHRSPVANSHAATEVTALPNGSLVANVAIPGGARLAELLGHEVEHLLERLDGARVSMLHALGDKSVRHTSGSFETARAVLVGRVVSAEYHAYRR